MRSRSIKWAAGITAVATVFYAAIVLATPGETRTGRATQDSKTQSLEEMVSAVSAVPVGNQTSDYALFSGASVPLTRRPTQTPNISAALTQQYTPTSAAPAVAAARKIPTPALAGQAGDDELSSVFSALTPGSSRATPTTPRTPTPWQQNPAMKIITYGAIDIQPYENMPYGNDMGLEMRLTSADNVRHFIGIELFKDGKEVDRIETSVFPNDAIAVVAEGLPQGNYVVYVMEKKSLVAEGANIAEITLTINDKKAPMASGKLTMHLFGNPQRDVAIRYFEEKGRIESEVWYGRMPQ